MTSHAIWRPAEGGLERLSVEGGWIYRDMNSQAMCFVPASGKGAAARPRPMPQAVPAQEEQAA